MDRATPRAPRLRDAVGAQLVLHGLGGDPPRVGSDYDLEQIVGAGGFGLICRATQRSLQRTVALKIYPLGGEADGGVRDALREARSLARLEHPGIVDVHAAGESDLVTEAERLPCAYVEMQLVEGQTFHLWLAAQPRSAAQVVQVLVEAGRALAHAHGQGVLHRDFKPDNVMVDTAGRARVIDFGLALATDPAADNAAPSDGRGHADALGTRATGTGLVRGTPGYMAPEATQGLPQAASDQFALAVVLREALTGQHPFVAGTRLTGDPPTEGAATYERLRPILDRAMAVAPEDRFASINAFCDAIEGALAPRRWPRVAAAIGLAGVLAAGGLGQWLWPPGDDLSAREEDQVRSAPRQASAPRRASAPPDDAPPSSPATQTVAEPPSPRAAAAEPQAPAPADRPPPPQPAAPDQPPPSCADLEAWAGTWQVGTRVLWTEYAYQLDAHIDYTLTLTVEPRCAIAVDVLKYPPRIEGQPRGEPTASTARSEAILDPPRQWRIPLRLDFEGDTRTYELAEHYQTELLLDHDPDGAPRLRGAFRKANAKGYVLRSGLLQGDRHLAPSPRSIDVDELPCPARCRVQCGGERSEQGCRERGCTNWSGDPRDICGPPSFDFLPPLRARATRSTVRSGNSPLARGLARGDRAQQLATCADHGRALAGRWAVWRIPKGPQATATRITVEISAEGCALSGTARVDPLPGPEQRLEPVEPVESAAEPTEPAEPAVEVTGEVTYAGSWVLTPVTPAPWFPEPMILVGVGPHAPAFGVDAADPMHRLRAHRLDP